MKRMPLALIALALAVPLVLNACTAPFGPAAPAQPPSAPSSPPLTPGGPGPYQQGPGGMMGPGTGGGMMGPGTGGGMMGPGTGGGMMGPGTGGGMMGPGTGGGMMGPGTGGGMMGPGAGGGMMGPGAGGGMMGPGAGGGYNPQAKPITPDQAADAARRYLNAYFGERLSLTEVIEFTWNFYAAVKEKDTGLHALELLIDKYTGQVSPEMGPNMMWNTKYGMKTSMASSYYPSGAPSAPMSVTPEQAKALAQQFLDARLPGLTVADADTFYGYYTLETLKGGQVEGMLSVNGYTGAVWYHTWHGPFISLKEFKD